MVVMSIGSKTSKSQFISQIINVDGAITTCKKLKYIIYNNGANIFY